MCILLNRKLKALRNGPGAPHRSLKSRIYLCVRIKDWLAESSRMQIQIMVCDSIYEPLVVALLIRILPNDLLT